MCLLLSPPPEVATKSSLLFLLYISEAPTENSRKYLQSPMPSSHANVVRKGPNCKDRCKHTGLTVGLAIPPLLTFSEPDKVLPSLFSSPKDGCQFCVRISCLVSQHAANTQEDNSNRAEATLQKRICGPRAYVCGEYTVWA